MPNPTLVHLARQAYPCGAGLWPELIGGLIAAGGDRPQIVICGRGGQERLPARGAPVRLALPDGRPLVIERRQLPGKALGLLVPESEPARFDLACAALLAGDQLPRERVVHAHVPAEDAELAGLPAATEHAWLVSCASGTVPHLALYGRDEHGRGRPLAPERSLPIAVDRQRLNPGRLPQLATPYGPRSLQRKRVCKGWVLRAAGLGPALNPPLLGIWLPPGASLPSALLEQLAAIPGQTVLITPPPFAVPLPRRVRALLLPEPDARHLAGFDLLLDLTPATQVNPAALVAARLGTPPLCLRGSAAAVAIERHLPDHLELVAAPDVGPLGAGLRHLLQRYGRGAAWRELCVALMTVAPDWSEVLGDYQQAWDQAAAVARAGAGHASTVALAARPDAAPLAAGPAPTDTPLPPPPPQPTGPGDASPGTFIDWGPPLPECYGEHYVGLLLQGPRRLYCYWEAPQGAPRCRLELVDLGAQGEPAATCEVEPLGERWLEAAPGRRYRCRVALPDGRVLLSEVCATPSEGPRDPGASSPAHSWPQRHLPVPP